jgi:hypothetical protein
MTVSQASEAQAIMTRGFIAGTTLAITIPIHLIGAILLMGLGIPKAPIGSIKIIGTYLSTSN